MKSYKKYIRLLSFLPAIFMMCLIFSFSAQNGEQSGSLSQAISEKIVRVADTLTGSSWDETEIHTWAERIEHPVRKLAHMSEYFVFSLTVALPLFLYGIRGWKLFFITIFFCAIFASTDEFHQSFAGGRGPSVKDVGIDTCGAFLGACAVKVGLRLASRVACKKQLHS